MPEDLEQEVTTEEPVEEPQVEEESPDFGFDFAGFDPEKEVSEGQEEGTEEPVEEEPSSTEESAQEGENELESLRAQNQFLLEQITKISNQALESQNQPMLPEQQPVARPNFEPMDFVKDKNFDDLMEDPKKFNEFMNEVAQQVILKATEASMLATPQITLNYMRTQMAMTDYVREFYDQNPELKEHKNMVSWIARQVNAENPELTADQVFKKTAEEAKKILQTKHQTLTTQGKRPAFAQTKGRGRGQAPKLTGRAAEIDAMLKSAT